MRTLVFAPMTFNLAETTRMIVVARAMGPGWRCVFQSYEEDYTHLIAEAGFEVRPLGPVLSSQERAQALAFDQGRSLRHPFTTELVRRRVSAERDLVREFGAEAVVMGTNVTSLISARAERVPLFYAVPLALTRPHMAQTGRLGLVAGDSLLARAGDRTASALLRLLYTRLPLAPRAFRVVAAENGAPAVRTVAQMVEGDVNLLTVMASELEGYRLPPGYVRVGPLFAQLPGEVPDEVLELAEGPRPLVYLALGSSGNRRLALGAAKALGDLPVTVLAPIGSFLDPGDRERLPRNVHVVDLLPAHRLGGIVDAAVLHGGQGTVQTSCATGVPFVGMGLQPEQAWNVAVCERAGNAVAVRPRDVGTQRFRTAVHRVLHDPSVRAAAARVRRRYLDEDGPAAAVREITATLG